jgi:hypothetical protein
VNVRPRPKASDEENKKVATQVMKLDEVCDRARSHVMTHSRRVRVVCRAVECRARREASAS